MSSPDSMQVGVSTGEAAAGGAHRVRGVCHVLYAFDVAFGIDLDEVERLIAGGTRRTILSHKRRAPRYFEYQPPPLRITESIEAFRIEGFDARPRIECTLFDFGAISVAFRIELDDVPDRLVRLSEPLYDNRLLEERARRRVESLLTVIAPALREPHLAEAVEDYVVFQFDSWWGGGAGADRSEAHRSTIARVLRAESGLLSIDEESDATSCRISFAPDDASFIDWHAAILFDDEAEDVIHVLEYVNVELLEMRLLDDRLDRVLDASYDVLSRRRWWSPLHSAGTRREIHRLAKIQTESAVLFEGVNNALKLVGDQFLARVYRLAAGRMRLADWEGSIQRKLQTAESIFGKISEHQAAIRMEVLEWIIILLIAVSILIAFLPVGGH